MVVQGLLQFLWVTESRDLAIEDVVAVVGQEQLSVLLGGDGTGPCDETPAARAVMPNGTTSTGKVRCSRTGTSFSKPTRTIRHFAASATYFSRTSAAQALDQVELGIHLVRSLSTSS